MAKTVLLSVFDGGFGKTGSFPRQGLQLFLKGLEDGPDAHGFLKHDDGNGHVSAEINHLPVDALPDLLLLLDDKHMAVENRGSSPTLVELLSRTSNSGSQRRRNGKGELGEM